MRESRNQLELFDVSAEDPPACADSKLHRRLAMARTVLERCAVAIGEAFDDADRAREATSGEAEVKAEKQIRRLKGKIRHQRRVVAELEEQLLESFNS